MQDDRENVIDLVAAEMKINMDCQYIRLVQAHIAITITALPNELLVISLAGLRQTLKQDTKATFVPRSERVTKFMSDVGQMTLV